MAARRDGRLDTDGLKKYVRRLAGERVFGDLGEEGYKSPWMERGNEIENPALRRFEFTQDVILDSPAAHRPPDDSICSRNARRIARR
jgi:hypothetical protein